MGNLKFGDISTKDLDLIIQTPPVYNYPEKNVSIEAIPGRNGDLVIDNNSWQNVERTYSIASVFRPGTDFISNSERLIKWLSSKVGYQRLEDSYDPYVYRLAEYKDAGSLVNYYDKATVIDITFICKPQRYLKSGEKSISFLGSVATLENPTGKTALPLITINNLIHQENSVVLITTTNKNKVDSIVTVSDLPSGDVILDSELQIAYSIQNGDINKYISLNEKDFPKLKDGITEVSVDKYIESSDVIEQYNSLINSKVVRNNTCFVKYKPFESMVTEKQKSIYMKSFDLLKQQEQNVYEVKSYSNYCLEKAQTYTFESFNTLLDNNCVTYSFQGDYSDAPSWLDISQNSDGTLKIQVGTIAGNVDSDYNYNCGFFYVENADNRIRLKKNGDTLADSVKVSTSITVFFYPATGNYDASALPGLNVSYSTKPNWLGVRIDYDDTQDHSPDKVTFTHTANGFYYISKTGLLSKSGWELYENSNGDLDSVSWKNYKKKFMPNGISVSTTASFTYYFLAKPYKPAQGSSPEQTYLQYEPVYVDELNEDGSVKIDANGNPVPKIQNDVYFEVTPDNTISNISITAKKKGYFRFDGDDIYNGWSQEINAGSTIRGSFSTKSSTIIYYLDKIPLYSSLDNWPEWLNQDELLNHGINSDLIGIRVAKDGWYRYTYLDENDKSVFSPWVFLQAGTVLGKYEDGLYINHYFNHDENSNIYMLEGIQSEFPITEYVYYDKNGEWIKDVAFLYIDEDGNEHNYCSNTKHQSYLELPQWISPIIESGSEEDHSDYMLKFYPNLDGYYKWDTMTVWNYKEISEDIPELTMATRTQDTLLYFMDSLPEYPTEGTTSHAIYNLCSVSVNKNIVTGNPEGIIISAKVAGYYKAKNSSSWKFYSVNEVICESKISENTDIHYLTISQDTLDNVTISIVPRWWSL